MQNVHLPLQLVHMEDDHLILLALAALVQVTRVSGVNLRLWTDVTCNRFKGGEAVAAQEHTSYQMTVHICTFPKQNEGAAGL